MFANIICIFKKRLCQKFTLSQTKKKSSKKFRKNTKNDLIMYDKNAQ
nr:MAG TPA: hypothetical protein [Caudoviricetes sp.]